MRGGRGAEIRSGRFPDRTTGTLFAFAVSEWMKARVKQLPLSQQKANPV